MTSDTSQPKPNHISAEDVVADVKAYYRAAAVGSLQGCCDPTTGVGDDRWGAARYDEAELADAPTASANLSMGCGNPYIMAKLNPGEHVLDLGSGGGLDAILSAPTTIFPLLQTARSGRSAAPERSDTMTTSRCSNRLASRT